jgi:hypothetical protein
MSTKNKYDWYFLTQPTVEEFQTSKETLHQIIQSVAAVGRTFSPESDEIDDAYGRLTWVPGLWRMAGVWVTGNETFRASVSLRDQKLYLADPRLNILDEVKLEGLDFNELMLWFEQHIISLGLSSSAISTELPYSLPAYTDNFKSVYTKEQLLYSPSLGGHFHDVFILLQHFQHTYDEVSEISIYPHHFDMEIKVVLKKTDDVSTDTFIRLGFSPGDEMINRPYLYINGRPHITGEKLPKAPAESYWITEEWYGLVLEFDQVYDKPDQQETMLRFYEDGFSIFKSLLID